MPILWRSEFRSVLAQYVRLRRMTIKTASAMMNEAEFFLVKNECRVNSDLVLKLIAQSKCSAYDCEYVALAEELHVPLVTMDREILREFPKVSMTMKEFVGSNLV